VEGAAIGAEGGRVLAPLFLETETICTPEVALANVRGSTSKPYRRFVPQEAHDRSISICGAGPSLCDTWKDLRGDVMACNSAIGFLKGKGVWPTFGMLWDADPIIEKFAVPVPYCTYYIASRCDPGVFSKLSGLPIVLWHATGDKGLLEMLAEIPSEADQPCVNGGSGAVTRAIYLAYAMGYRDIHLHGADSSYGHGEWGYGSHVAGSVVPEVPLNVFLNKTMYRTSAWMAAQAQELRLFYKAMCNMGATITAHGKGLLPDMWKALNAD
jgi:hypothetical protein